MDGGWEALAYVGFEDGAVGCGELGVVRREVLHQDKDWLALEPVFAVHAGVQRTGQVFQLNAAGSNNQSQQAHHTRSQDSDLVAELLQ